MTWCKLLVHALRHTCCTRLASAGAVLRPLEDRRVFSSSRLLDDIDILPQGASILLSPCQRLSQATTRAQTLCFLRCISESVWYENVTWRQTSCAERCRSGRTGRIRNPLYLQGYPGFESLSLCHNQPAGDFGSSRSKTEDSRSRTASADELLKIDHLETAYSI